MAVRHRVSVTEASLSSRSVDLGRAHEASHAEDQDCEVHEGLKRGSRAAGATPLGGVLHAPQRSCLPAPFAQGESAPVEDDSPSHAERVSLSDEQITRSSRLLREALGETEPHA